MSSLLVFEICILYVYRSWRIVSGSRRRGIEGLGVGVFCMCLRFGNIDITLEARSISVTSEPDN